jgi:hypothetical protein
MPMRRFLLRRELLTHDRAVLFSRQRNELCPTAPQTGLILQGV